MKKKIIFIIILFILTACSDPHHIDGKYVIKGFGVANKGVIINELEDMENESFYVVIKNAKTIEFHLNGNSWEGMFEGKGNDYNTPITWLSIDSPGDSLFEGAKIHSTKIGFPSEENKTNYNNVNVNFYLSNKGEAEFQTYVIFNFEKIQ